MIPSQALPAIVADNPNQLGTSTQKGSIELLKLLTHPNTTKDECQSVIFNPATFKVPELTIGNVQSESKISSTLALKTLLLHIQTSGYFFTKIHFINCDFTSECYEVLIQSLPQCEQLKSLTFEHCCLNIDRLIELISTLITLDKNLQEVAITHNPSPFNFEVMECLDCLLQIPSALAILKLDHNGLKDEFILLLSKALMNNCSVHTLSLNHNQITMKGMLALSEWVKSHPDVRMCSLVHNGHLTADNYKELESRVARKPSPFIFMPTLLPIPSESSTRLLSLITHSKKYDNSQWNLIKTITDPVERQSYFELWLTIGFNITHFEKKEEKGPMSFFKAIALACRKPQWSVSLFYSTRLYIREHIQELTYALQIDFPDLYKQTDLMQFIDNEIFEKGKWAENTIRLAIQKILQENQIFRPLYFYTPWVKPDITPDGELLPNVGLRFETLEKPGPHSSSLEEPIYLYFDGENQFSLLTKKTRLAP